MAGSPAFPPFHNPCLSIFDDIGFVVEHLGFALSADSIRLHIGALWTLVRSIGDIVGQRLFAGQNMIPSTPKFYIPSTPKF